MNMLRRPLVVLFGSLLASSLLLLSPDEASAQTDFNYRGQLESDLRVRVRANDPVPDEPDFAFERSDNSARLTAAFSWGPVQAVADLAIVFSGRRNEDEFSDLTQRAKVDPWYFESDALYVEIFNFVLDGIDLRLGRQIVEWGVADRFNPTSVVNPYDLEDPIDFGRQMANEMVVLSINPPWYVEGEEIPILDEINLTLVAVPIFRSALLPDTARLGFTSPSQFGRFVHSDLLDALIDVQNAFLDQGGGVTYDVRVEPPSVELENMQFGARGGFSLYGVDLSFIYYHGYDHNVQPSQVTVGDITFEDGSTFAYPADLGDPSITGDPDALDAFIEDDLLPLLRLLGEDAFNGATVGTDAVLTYPEVDVVGANFATSLDFLGGLGLWGEVAFTFHDGVPLSLTVGDFPPCGAPGPDGQPVTTNCIPQQNQIESGWFWKLTAGMDYSITRWWYTNVQYLHGFVDEFGSENLGDYIVAGMDFKTFSEQVLIRLFGILQLPTNGADPNAVAYPELSFNFWQNTSLIAGALIHIGPTDEKFSARTAGPDIVFIKGRYSF